jgi:hypothetical protein
VVAAARAHGETAIGYLLAGAEGGQGQVVVNPQKTARRAYAASDRIIVLSVD